LVIFYYFFTKRKENKTKKNNKILPVTPACCGAVVRNECRDHFSCGNVVPPHLNLFLKNKKIIKVVGTTLPHRQGGEKL
jgi:hypothetical protein